MKKVRQIIEFREKLSESFALVLITFRCAKNTVVEVKRSQLTSCRI